MKTYSATGDLDKEYRAGRWREGTQRNLVADLLRSGKPWTIDSLVVRLDSPAYWATLKWKDKNGEPSEDSWLMTKAGGIRASVGFHLNGLLKDGLIKVVEG